MSIDVKKARLETPGCFGAVFLHHSGASQMPYPVVDAMHKHLDLELAIGGYEAEEQAGEQLDNAYNAVARMLSCRRSEIALLESATAGWNAAFYGIAQTFKEGDRILTAFSEYVSNMIAYLQVERRCGVKVEIVPDDANGQLDVRALENLIDHKVKLISVTHVPTYNGLVNPVNEIGQIARSYDIPYLVDACQSAGQMPLNVETIGCDALSATGRKFLRGPRGTGFLYVRESALERIPPATLDLRAADWTGPKSYELKAGARRYEMFESSIAARIGLGVAVDYAMSWDMQEIYSRVRYLAGKMRRLLSDVPGVAVRDKGTERCGIVTFSLDGFDASEVQMHMRQKNVHVGVSRRSCAVLDFDRWGIDSLVRCPVHYYNTDEEIEFFVNEVKKLSSSDG